MYLKPRFNALKNLPVTGYNEQSLLGNKTERATTVHNMDLRLCATRQLHLAVQNSCNEPSELITSDAF